MFKQNMAGIGRGPRRYSTAEVSKIRLHIKENLF